MSELFAKLPLSVLSRRDLQPSDKLTFAAINFYQGANADAYPGIRTIAAKTGLTPPTVIESIKRLEATGLLVVQRMGIGKGNHYQVISVKAALPVKPLNQSSRLMGSVKAALPEVFKPLKHIRLDQLKDQEESASSGEEKNTHTEQSSPDQSQEGQQVPADTLEDGLITPEAQADPATGGAAVQADPEGTEASTDAPDAGGAAGDAAQAEKEPAVEKPARKKPVRKKSSPADPEGFERFWQAYPRRIAKDGALKAWQKLKPDSELVGKILAAIEAQRKSEQWQKDDGKFIPYPASWLNGRRWEDEIEADSDSIENGDWTADEEYLKRVDFALAKMRARA